MEAHNDYLQLLVEGGWLVTVPALVLVWLVAREVRRRFREARGDRTGYWIRLGAVTGFVCHRLPGNRGIQPADARQRGAVHRPVRDGHQEGVGEEGRTPGLKTRPPRQAFAGMTLRLASRQCARSGRERGVPDDAAKRIMRQPSTAG